MDYPASAWIAKPPQQLLIRDILPRARQWAPEQKIIYRDLREMTYATFCERVERLAHVLTRLGVKAGDRVGVMDWDSHRYLELFFAVPMLGAVLHTVNVRLTPEQVGFTIAHARDSVVLFHPDFLPLAEALAPKLPGVTSWISLSDDGRPPATSLQTAGDYESLVEAAPAGFKFPDLDENTVATLFYTTGTTGDPKGVFFTHRQLMLHTLAAGLTFAAFEDPASLRGDDVYMPLTPMFHVHGWGVPYIATLLGIRQIYPGRYEPATLCALIGRHRPTFSHCVPTILQMILNNPGSSNLDLTGFKIVIGGAPLTAGLIQVAQARGIRIFGGYGMSETCPVVATNQLKPSLASGSPEQRLEALTRTGFPLPLVEAAAWNADDQPLPPGRENAGELVLRAPWLTAGYYNDPERTTQLWRGGWLHTGDIAYIDPDGFIRITDRLKDVIKIGGEWISTLEIENALSQHPAVKEVAVLGVRDAKWDERPHAEVVLKPEFAGKVTPKDLAHHLHKFIDDGTIHKRAILTVVRLTEALPKTSVGKLDKKALRASLQAKT